MWRLLRRFISNHLVPVSSDGLDPARLLLRVPDGVGSEKLARALIVVDCRRLLKLTCFSTFSLTSELCLSRNSALDWLLFKVALIRCGVVKPLVRSVGGHRRCYRPIETRALPIAEAILIQPSLFPI
jgi:hypothetical protein